MNTDNTHNSSGVHAPVRIVPKGWGREEWIHNDKRYCGKVLEVKAGKKSSFHFHNKKYETFYVVHGHLRMRVRPEGGAEEYFEMQAGDILDIAPGLVHQFTALQDSTIIEFSTQHFDDDSHRVELGD